MKRITSIDIAKLAGVSQTTVSRVLRGKARDFNISDDTAERVKKIADANHYKLNRNARSFVSQKSYNIGFAVRELRYLTMHSFSKVVSGIISESAKRDYNFSVCVLSNTDLSLENLHYRKKIQERMVDGLIIKDISMPEEDIMSLNKLDIPFVLMDIDIPYENFYCVINDYVRASYLLTEHLAELGHKNMVLLCETKQVGLSDFIRGFQYAVSKFKIPHTTDILLEDGFNPNIDEILKHNPTAIICEHDHTAVPIIKLLIERGIRVPEDISVCGCGNTIEAVACNPGLTSTELFQTIAGEESTRLLFDIMDKRSISYRKITIPVELVVRNSTGPAPRKKK